MMRTILLFVAFGLLSLQVGCMSPVQRLDKDAVIASLHKGETQAEVRQLLGQPKRWEGGSNGKSLDVFITAFPAFGSAVPKTEVRSVYVLYDASGHLERFTWYAGEPTDHATRFNEQWRSGRPFTSEDLSRIERNVSSRDDLIRLFGPPTSEGLDVYGYKILSWVFLEGHKTSLQGGQELVVRVNAKAVAIDYLLRNIQP
jgi:hypothetical protein